jgi:hypothetical protein
MRRIATAAKPSDQDKLFAQVSRRAVEVANNYYTAGKVPEAQAAVQDVVSYAEKARTAAQSSGKNLKQTEIELREAARRLEQVRRSLALEDRPYVEAAVNRVEQVRKDLLDQMFGLKPKDKEKK